jgi:hypothetical protein
MLAGALFTQVPLVQKWFNAEARDKIYSILIGIDPVELSTGADC